MADVTTSPTAPAAVPPRGWLSPVNQRRWQNFKANRRGYWSLWIFLVLFGLSLCAEFIANDRPIVASYKGELLFPVVINYPEEKFGGFLAETDYRSDFIRDEIEANGWMIWPPIRYSYQTVNSNIPHSAPTALPLSIGGAFVLLLLTHQSFSMPSLIGLLMLMGICTKNSILLVEYAIVARRDHGLSRYDALLDACHKRARPIVMTTLAMGFGMLPIAMGFGADPSFRAPMAIAVIGGLVTSTVLSLVVVPAVYTYVDDAEGFLKRLWAKRPGQQPKPPRPQADPAIGD